MCASNHALTQFEAKDFLRRSCRHLHKANLNFPTCNRHFQSHKANFEQYFDVNQLQPEPLSDLQFSCLAMHESRPTVHLVTGGPSNFHQYNTKIILYNYALKKHVIFYTFVLFYQVCHSVFF